MLTILLALIAIAFYSGGATIPALRLVRGPDLAPSKPLMLALGTAAIVMHAGALSSSLMATGGLYFQFFGAASIVGWIMAMLVLLASLRRPLENLAIFVFPLAGLSALLGALLIRPQPGYDPMPAGLASHVYSSLIAYSVLAVGVLQAGLLSLQDYKLRHKRPGGFVRLLPPLQIMEGLLFQMVGLGFALLTLSLVTGFVFLEDMFAQHVAHKTVLSIIAWVVFGILLLGRWRFGWRGQVAIRWTIAGFFVLMLAFFGSKMVLELILS